MIQGSLSLKNLLPLSKETRPPLSDVMRQIKSDLLFHGISAPFIVKKSWSKKYVDWLKELPIKSEPMRIAFNYLIELYEYLTAQLIKTTKTL
jgi:hypothetical protein